MSKAEKAPEVQLEIGPNNGTAIQPVRASVTPMELLRVAMDQNADLDRLEKLMELQLRWEANEAKKAFHAAKNAFKAEAPTVLKNKQVTYQTSKGTVSYDHATLDAACDALIPALSKHGLSHRWKIEQPQGLIRVTCILTHELGYSEEATMEGPPDNSGSKNPIQEISSSTNYLERYTFFAVTGTAPRGTDSDGGTMGMDKYREFFDSISTAPNLQILETTFKAAYKEATAQKNTKAMLNLVDAKDKRKKELASPNNGGPF